MAALLVALHVQCWMHICIVAGLPGSRGMPCVRLVCVILCALGEAGLKEAGLKEAMSKDQQQHQQHTSSSSSSKRPAGGPACEDAVANWKLTSKKIFLSNKLSAKDAKEMIQSSEAAGAVGHRLNSQRDSGNDARTLFKHFAKECPWPSFYWATIQVLDLKTKMPTESWHPFLLPHEWVSAYCADPLACEDAKPVQGSWHQKHIADVARELGQPEEGFIPLAIHGDGVPVQGTLNEQSLETLSMNLPTSRTNSGLRVPFTFIQKRYCCSETMEQLLSILHWSLMHLALGVYPKCRHDGSSWQKCDKDRASAKGGLTTRGLLSEIRGDWDFFETVLSFPAYNRLSGMCWMCNATYGNFKTQAWRNMPFTDNMLFQRLARDGKHISVIFNLPGVKASLCRPDWMHTVDLGVAADICGHIFVMLLETFDGTLQQKCTELWKQLQQWYASTKPQARLKRLDLSMFRPGGSAPKLKGKAAEIRALVPWLPVACQKWHAGTQQQQTALSLCKQLAVCYECLDDFNASKLKLASQKVATLYIALEADALRQNPTDTHTWRVKPKLHLFQHLCELGGDNPRDFWCYADETAQGSYSDLFTRRGGKDNASVNALRVLQRWTGLKPFPTIPR